MISRAALSGTHAASRVRTLRPSLTSAAAHALSIVFCPPLAVVFVALTAAGRVPSVGLFWATVLAAGCSLLPAAMTFVLWRRGVIADLDLSRRGDRLVPVLTGIAGAIVTCVLAWLLAPAVLPLFVSTLALYLALGWLTVHLKVSIHAATLAGWCGLCLATGALPAALLVGLAAVATGWARLQLGRHRPREVGLGLAVGFLMPTGVLLVVGLG